MPITMTSTGGKSVALNQKFSKKKTDEEKPVETPTETPTTTPAFTAEQVNKERLAKEELLRKQSGITFKEETRATDTPASANVDITNLTPLEKAKTSMESSIIGQEIANLKEKGLRAKAKDILVTQETEKLKQEEAIKRKAEIDALTNEQKVGNIETPTYKTIKNIVSLPYEERKKAILTNANLAKGEVLKPIAKIYDFVSSLFQGGKGIEQREAESTISQVEGDFSVDIEAVKQGLKNPQDVKNMLVVYENAINRLEESVHGTNSINYRNLITGGADVEARVLLAKDNIEGYKRQLAEAELASLQIQATKNLGI